MNKKEIRRTLRELDRAELPNKERMLSFGAEVSVERETVSRRNAYSSWSFRPALAAAVVLVLAIIGVSGYAIAEEAKEYNEAVNFFKEYELSAEGLSRAEIKEVYRDITLERFESGKSLEVIVQTIKGYEFPALNQGNAADPGWLHLDDNTLPALEEVKMLWDVHCDILANSDSNEPYVEVHYDYSEFYHYNPVYDCDELHYSDFNKYVDDELQWSVRLLGLYITDYAEIDGGVAICGNTMYLNGSRSDVAKLIMVGTEGNIIWERIIDEGSKNERIFEVIQEDEILTVFSRRNYDYLCVTKYDLSGNKMGETSNLVEGGISEVTKLKDGYAMHVDGLYYEDSYIAKLDEYGNIIKRFKYSSEDEFYSIISIFEYKGRIYVSATASPKVDESDSYGGRGEIAKVLETIFRNDYFPNDEQMLKLMRDNNTAVLFVCENESGEVEEFYSADGAMAGELYIDPNGDLVWDTGDIIFAEFSPATSAFTIYGTCRGVSYVFSQDDQTINRVVTDTVSQFFK